MFSIVVLCLLGSFCASSAQNFSTSRENNWPLDLITPFPYRTISTIDIDTSDVRLIATPTPLKVVVGQFESHTIANTGNSVMVTAKQLTLTSITGGVLGSGKYMFQELEYYWSGSYRGKASDSLDDTYSPLQVRIVFRNTKYANTAIAVTKRDGLAILVININVEGYAPNPLFPPFGALLQKIVLSGSSVTSSSPPLFQWFNQIAFIQHYYAYPGAYVLNPVTQYDCATIIHTPKSGAFYISITQFGFFQRLLSYQGTPITNVLPTVPRGRRPVVQACGNIEYILPTNI